jgi:hypothetical protein
MALEPGVGHLRQGDREEGAVPSQSEREPEVTPPPQRKREVGEAAVSFPLLIVLLVSAACWAVLFVALPPGRQDFPLNDDWAFGRGAFFFASGQGVRYWGWASMPQLGQWIWACPFIWTVGESFVALRLSTILLSWLGLLALYDLLGRVGGVTPQRAAFAVAALALNPLFFMLQGTFMTDVPSLSFSLIALAFYVRAFEEGRASWLWAAAGVAIMGAITRQNTVAAPVAAGILLWRSPSIRGRFRFAFWGAVAIPIAVAGMTHFWFERRPDITKMPLLHTPTDMFLLPFVIVHLCGLSVLPLIVLDPLPRSWRRFGVGAAVMLACAGYWWQKGQFLQNGGLFPYCAGLIGRYGALVDLVVGERDLFIDTKTSVCLSILGCVAGAWLVDRLIDKVRGERGWDAILLFAALQLLLVMLPAVIFDRYLLFFFPAAVYVAADRRAGARLHWAPAVGTLALFGLLSVGMMHDWLAWNAARWELGRAAEKRGINPLDIEGGFEWDGWYFCAGKRADGASSPKGLLLPFSKNIFPDVTGHYVLTFSETPNTKILDSRPYEQWLMPAQKTFFLVEVTMPTVPVAPKPIRAEASTTGGPATLEGKIDLVNSNVVAGWAWNVNEPDVPIHVDIYDGSKLLATVPADEPRADLVKARIGNGKHGFIYRFPDELKDGKAHSIIVRVHMDLPGRPDRTILSR